MASVSFIRTAIRATLIHRKCSPWSTPSSMEHRPLPPTSPVSVFPLYCSTVFHAICRMFIVRHRIFYPKICKLLNGS
ncbi:unnamed protein product [Gongylonema pulchrum]|uniref:Uncharacterized protein n=1 Tax=Gongylonema pulchrum TaxID=637853 RepID=A0A3P7RNJ3_9BILA|nr:unnamed protein product [Gongylonema pulchrum]